ncbi:hypothetical protein [Thetidibacter halocola]|uniref:DUF1127 domain-containing protein n=1 Tax=Thetidibacter halocola TaxID=2827239 RepID=A0A8J7WFK0_9RHOB|nr:hypothetical protein [Thetidibacter halocola]MBS0124418.1 hypothetical protein [Thetidibacter halocola]
MTTMIATLIDRAERRARFLRTRNELRALPMSVRRDLDIEGHEEDVARHAVYG